jgi:hypothetical protein
VHWGLLRCAALPARLTVDSGDTVVVDTFSGWQEVADLSLMRPLTARW